MQCSEWNTFDHGMWTYEVRYRRDNGFPFWLSYTSKVFASPEKGAKRKQVPVLRFENTSVSMQTGEKTQRFENRRLH